MLKIEWHELFTGNWKQEKYFNFPPQAQASQSDKSMPLMTFFCLLKIMFGCKASSFQQHFNYRPRNVIKMLIFVFGVFFCQVFLFWRSRSQYLRRRSEFCFAWIYLEMDRLVHISTFEFYPSSYLSCFQSLGLLAKFFLLHAVSSGSHFLSWLTICSSVLFRWVSKRNEPILSDPVSESISPQRFRNSSPIRTPELSRLPIRNEF